MKSDLTDQPTFRLLWDEAYKKLESATHVIFIGYSMPLTDIPAGFLFGEAIRKSAKIDVVNLSERKEQKEIQKLISNYQSVMPRLTKKLFDFDGARPWLKERIHHLKGTGLKGRTLLREIILPPPPDWTPGTVRDTGKARSCEMGSL